MIICFDCSPEAKKSLDFLLESGQYKDYSEAINSAITNLEVLQKEVLKSGSVVIGHNSKVSSSAISELPVFRKQNADTQSLEESSQKFGMPLKPPTIPRMFLQNNLASSSAHLAIMPDDVWAKGQDVPLDRWIFGQYNKLLPAKASCRALANLLTDNPKGVVLEEAATLIAKEAATLGDFLAYQDKQNSITRDEAFSTAFPTSGKDIDKSLSRYANQFVASVNKQRQVSGLLTDFKLINSKSRKGIRLMLTEAGWNFAVMPNPILDNKQKRPTKKFSEDERDFLLAHIKQHLPVEYFAYYAVLTAIIEGSNTPDTIDSALQRHVSQDKERKLSKSFLSSQRSGAISRMTDLGLVTRVRDGVRVSYVATEIGEQFIKNSN